MLTSLIDNNAIGHLVIMHQSLEFVLKRVDVIFKELIENEQLKKRWLNIHPLIKKIKIIRNDVAHSSCDINPEDKNEFILVRFSETETLKLSQRERFYTIKELISDISKLKKTNIRLGYLFHTTYGKYTNSLFVGNGNGSR